MLPVPTAGCWMTTVGEWIDVKTGVTPEVTAVAPNTEGATFCTVAERLNGALVWSKQDRPPIQTFAREYNLAGAELCGWIPPTKAKVTAK